MICLQNDKTQYGKSEHDKYQYGKTTYSKTEYDKKENLRRMLDGKPYEHIPVSFFQHFPPGDTKGDACVEAHVKFYEKTGFDFLKIMHDGLTAPIDLNIRTLIQLKEYRAARQHNPYIQEYLERAGRINDRLSGKVDTFCNVFSPFTLLRRIGDERLLEFIKEDAGAVRDALRYLGEDLAYLSTRLIKDCGCLGIFLALQGAETGLLDPDWYSEYVQPGDMLVLEAAQQASSSNILHFCGWNQTPNQLKLWRNYPGKVVNWAIYVEKLALPEGRRYFGMRHCLGGFDNRRGQLLYAGNYSQVEKETWRLLEEYHREFHSMEGLMIGGDCSYLPDFDTKRFRWVAEAVRAWETEHTGYMRKE